MNKSILTSERLAILRALRLNPGHCAAEIAPQLGRFVSEIGDDLRLLQLDRLVSHTGNGWELTESGHKVVGSEVRS